MKNFIRRSYMYFVVLFLVLGVTLFVPSPSVFAMAPGAVGSLTVQAYVSGTCSVNTTPITFANYSGSTVYSHGYFNVTCTNGLQYSIILDGGITGNYRMTNGNNFLQYWLSTTPNSTGQVTQNNNIDLIDSPLSGAGTGTGSEQNIPIYGRILGNQTIGAVGQYTDTIGVTVFYTGES